MNKLLLVLLVWLSACGGFRYTAFRYPSPYYATSAAPLYLGQGRAPVATLIAGERYNVVGVAGEYYVVVTKGHRTYLVSPSALMAVSSTTPASTDYSTAPAGTVHDTYTGPRGGRYYYNGNGNKTYVTPQSTLNREYIQTGPRGGQYYINKNGNKTYIKR